LTLYRPDVTELWSVKTSRSRELFNRAQRYIPGGVNSPVRAWKSVGVFPRFVARGAGAYIFDADDNRYIDFVGSWGPLILGHRHPRVTGAIQKALAGGTTFGAPTESEVEIAELVRRHIRSIEKLRLVSSGTEATMTAVRLARAFTGRSKILKFDGCYHGHSDAMLVRAGSGVATFSLPDSPGIPQGFVVDTLVAPFNDILAVDSRFKQEPETIAGIIVEPVCGNMGVIPPEPDFLPALRELTRKYGAVLIFDEVITGFRLALGGAQNVYQVEPDLTCLGKVLGGGLPLAGFGGKKEIMDMLAPDGPVYQAGTLSGNPLAVAAGLATLKQLAKGRAYSELEQKGKRLQEGLETVLRKHGIHAVINRVGSMMTLFFGTERVGNADDARRCDRERFVRFFHGMLNSGIYWPPSPFEAAFVSLAHSKNDLDKTLNAFEDWARKESKG